MEMREREASMRFRLVHPATSPGRLFVSDPANGGFEPRAIIELLRGLEGRGHAVEVVDSETISDADRESLYWDAVEAVERGGARYGIRTIFGSRRGGGGPFFGDQVPALLMYKEGASVDV